MSQITIKPSIASGKVMVPPSKSYTHRLLIAAALSNSDVEVKNVVLSNDIKATLNCLKTLGKTIDIVDGEYLGCIEHLIIILYPISIVKQKSRISIHSLGL